MRLVTALFDRDGDYRRMYRVLERSAAEFMPEVKPELIHCEPPEGSDPFRDTYFGFLPAAREALTTEEPIAVADADLMFTGSITDVWDFDFDLAFTARDHRMRYNTGLWFARPTDAARKFMADWIDETALCYDAFSMRMVHDNGGIDQQSLFNMLQRRQGAKILLLPCQIWNAEQTCWNRVTPETKVIHIKSGLRPVCLGRAALEPKHARLQPIVDKWRHYDCT